MFGDFQVGPWVVQPRLNSLSVNDSSLHIEPKVMQVLVCLAEHAGEVVEKEKIIQTVWSDTFVTDDVLTRAIGELRRVFDDDPKEPRFIQTIPKTGYRLIAPVEALTPSPSPSGRGWPARPGEGARRYKLAVPVTAGLVGAAVAVLAFNVAGLRDRMFPRAAPPAGKIRLVVLPFDNYSGDPEQEYLSDGITEEMTAQLARLQPERLLVIGRASAMTYKGRKKSIDEIGKALNVQYILEGSVRRQGDRVRITAQLIEVGDQVHVWAENYERDLRDILAVQAEVGRAVANTIRLKLTPRGETRLAGVRPVDPEAYELYIKGRFYWDKRADDELRRSIEYFQKAVEKDPTYAPAYAALSAAYNVAGFRGLHAGDEAYSKAEALARRALELDESLGEAHAALVMSSCLCKELEGAVFPVHVFIQAVEDGVDDAIHALDVDEADHRSGAAADLDEAAFDEVGSAQLAPPAALAGTDIGALARPGGLIHRLKEAAKG